MIPLSNKSFRKVLKFVLCLPKSIHSTSVTYTEANRRSCSKDLYGTSCDFFVNHNLCDDYHAIAPCSQAAELCIASNFSLNFSLNF